MERYPWPGNVRELANIVERLSIMQPGAEVTGARVREVLRPTPSASRARWKPRHQHQTATLRCLIRSTITSGD
jgi:DNA-binding NtrC family response regulator